MKNFANRNILKKIIIIFSLIFSMSFVEPAPVEAGIGGTLMEPICDLLVGLGDGFLNVTHHILIGQETTLIKVNLNDGLLDIARVVVTALAFVAVVAAAAIITGGAAIAIGAVTGALAAQGAAAIAASAIFANIVPIAVLGTFFGVKAYSMDAFDNELALPMYSISPERIFSNTVPFFDVNFFNPNSAPFKYEWVHLKRSGEFDDTASGKFVELTAEEEALNLDFSKGTEAKDEVKEYLGVKKEDNVTVYTAKKLVLNGKTYFSYTRQVQKEDGSISFETFKRRLNDGTSSEGGSSGNGEKHAFSYELANTVKFWYGIIRTLAIVGMMSVLVYIGIRILLSSTAEQKAKHKELLKDWLVGMVLLFTMQYIMIFANIAVDHLTDLLKNINPMGQTALIPDDKGKVESELKLYEIGTTTVEKNIQLDSNNNISSDSKVVFKKSETGSDGITHTYIEWNTDLMGQLRIALQAHRNDNESYIGYTIMYFVMIIYTAIFFFTYTKRVIYMAFLTIISPLVALTYPIDKVNDGSAQGFNYWFKEYIFNLLLQPLHLLIYTVLVSTAIKFAAENILYSLVVLGFITQAEKIVRAMFNFSKATTPGIFAGPAGAAMTMTGMRWLMGHGPKGAEGGKSGKISAGANSNGNTGMLRTNNDKYKNDDAIMNIIGSGQNANGNSTGSVVNGIVNGNNDSTIRGESGQNVVNVLGTNGGENQTGDNWNDFYRTNEFTDGDISGRFDQTGDYWDNYYGTNEFTDGNVKGVFDQTGDYWDNYYGTNESTDGNVNGGFVQTEDNRSDFYGSDISNTNSSDRNTNSQIQLEAENIRTRESNDVIDNNQAMMQQENQTNNKDNNLEHRSALGAAVSAYREGMKDKITDGLQNARPGRAIGRAIGGTIGAAAFGTIGVAAGVASGDMKSVMTDGIVGIAGGTKLGSGVMNSASNLLKVDSFEEDFKKAYYGEDKIAERNRKYKASSKENVDRIMEKYKDKGIKTRKQAEEKAKELSDYWKYNDKLEWDDIIKLDKLNGEKVVDARTGNSRELKKSEIVQAHKDINKYGIANMKGDKDRAEIARQFVLDHSNLKISEEQALGYVDKLRRWHNKMND